MLYRKLTSPPAVCQRMRADWIRAENRELCESTRHWCDEEPRFVEWDDGQALRELGDRIEVDQTETTT